MSGQDFACGSGDFPKISLTDDQLYNVKREILCTLADMALPEYQDL